MRTWMFILTCLFVGVVAAILYQAFRPRPQPLQVAGEAEAPVSRPVPEVPPEIRHPVSEAPVRVPPEAPPLGLEEPLPELGGSDRRMQEVLEALLPDLQPGRLLVFDNFIQRFVVMVDSLPRAELPATHLPTRKVPGSFLVQGSWESLAIDPANYRRYDPFLKLAEAVDPELAVAVYVRFYPLFQESYVQLGYPAGYFNDRLVEVIDHLLATPMVTDPIRLVQPKVRYLFADPELEALSAGRKLLIRTGPENAARIRDLLRTYRGLLAGALPGGG